MDNPTLISICIPSYNRPKELLRLLKSIDVQDPEKIEVVIREDCAPLREEVRKAVNAFRVQAKYHINYIENETNFGYDKNIRNIAKSAQGTWVIFMGDDDVFIKGALDKYIRFLEENPDLGYVLRRYKEYYPDGSIDERRYYNKNTYFEPGDETIVELFRRSLFISGVTFRKDLFYEYDISALDGTLAFQLYIQACVCQNNMAAYCDVPLTISIRGGTPYFGKSESEKTLYKSGENTYDNSLNFLKQVRKLTTYFDRKHNANITKGVLKSYSKYSYGFLFEHRNDGRRVFRNYAKEVKRIGLGDSAYFYIYYWGLYIFGTQTCHNTIVLIKKILGRTPKL